MESKSEMASEPESEIDSEENLEKQNLSDEGKAEESMEIKMTSANPELKSKRPKVCDEDPYIVKLLKSLMNTKSQRDSEEKKK